MRQVDQDLPALVEAAAVAFRDATGIPVHPRKASPGYGADTALEFHVGSHRFKRQALVRQTIDRYGALATLRAHGAPSPDERLLLVTSYLSPNMIDACRDMQIDALDLAGNASLLLGDNVILVSGRPRPDNAQSRRATWTRSTLRVALALLTVPSLLEETYRGIAQVAGVSHGTVQNAVHALLSRRDLIEQPGGRGMRFADAGRLIDEWTTLYPTLLRGSLQIGHYRTDVPDWWRGVPELPDRCRFGGEPAAAILTDYLKPAAFTVYCTDEVPREWVAKARLRRDRDGNIEFLKSPIRFTAAAGYPQTIAPPLLVYADLVASGDSRNLETARLLRERYLPA
ncbi:type IV toxin-antitoxin system AbiEi family antitoxin [Burkholderia cenocepacia]|uniref:type IV toxin-antitoxin system AbiEi family antitoxin n=1 Tax=Burkholderia cenocepacia TaxID=95486 RepID=UPI0028633D45|nr:type IV toxin-antitoxin system AbiEi family antitoxin [Burkholderia cenocepacia]MDR5646437.1 type IV toxin-antitoxin system AbiEi family antitoxin [Burkholderia cenocepacia]